jgi:hypothetical protein
VGKFLAENQLGTEEGFYSMELLSVVYIGEENIWISE